MYLSTKRATSPPVNKRRDRQSKKTLRHLCFLHLPSSRPKQGRLRNFVLARWALLFLLGAISPLFGEAVLLADQCRKPKSSRGAQRLSRFFILSTGVVQMCLSLMARHFSCSTATAEGNMHFTQDEAQSSSTRSRSLK